MTLLQQLPDYVKAYVEENSEAVARAAAARILQEAERAIAARGCFKLVLAGGTTPQATYRLLATAEADWSKWHIFFGDERCLPPQHEERNSRMAFEAWLKRVPIPSAQIHPIAAEQGAESAAAKYHQLLLALIPFDMVLLGMGEDGHIASLFPGQHHDETRLAVAVNNAPKPPSARVSLSIRALAETGLLLLLVTGAAKREALQRWGSGAPLPVALLHPACGVEMLLDREAAGT